MNAKMNQYAFHTVQIMNASVKMMDILGSIVKIVISLHTSQFD